MMLLTRQDLESRSRNELLKLARDVGVDKPSYLSQEALIDEILRVTIEDDDLRTKARGLLGRARDLVARVMERRTQTSPVHSTTQPETTGSTKTRKPVPTIKLARVYLNQGLKKQARAVLEELLERDPNNEEARVLLEDWKSPPPQSPIPSSSQRAQERQVASAALSKPTPSQTSVASERTSSATSSAPSQDDSTKQRTHSLAITELDHQSLKLYWRLDLDDFLRRSSQHSSGYVDLVVTFVEPNTVNPAGLTQREYRRRIDSFEGSALVPWLGRYATASMVWTNAASSKDVLAVTDVCPRPDNPPA